MDYNASEMKTVLMPAADADFVETDYIRGIAGRALTYVNAGFPVHFRGPSGTGKTTLAMHLAHLIGRPVVLMHGDSETKSSDLVGGEHGYRLHRVVDNFIHSVHKFEEDMVKRWVDSRLTLACKNGFTLVYDEFSRSRPEANNILLSVLQEKILDIPTDNGKEQFIKVHPQFTAIFTSNPEDYAGVNRTQDALRDRMITIDVDHFDLESEIQITGAKSGLPLDEVQKVVAVVRGLRESEKSEYQPTVRASIMISRTLNIIGKKVEDDLDSFALICKDILSSATSRVGSKANQMRVNKVIDDKIKEVLMLENIN